ncbi:MAG: phosphoribosylanthranilate isomerase [Acutalibacteraceae bacterium]|nr:phosphoribosylanthranilate isomerase [Acutalibacteraceae bacterium]
MSLVKICGLKRECDIDYVNRHKPDFAGFVFSKSKRQITPQQAEKLKVKLNSNIKVVGVFVNEPVEFILDLCNRNIIDIIQLHGDEDKNYIVKMKELSDKPIIKAVRVQSTEQVLLAEKLDCDYLLLDAYSESEYGGSGKTFNWDIIPQLKKPFFLAGGLNSENVAMAIKQVNPYCVDLSSGVETGGYKDKNKLKIIIEEVRRTK